MSYLSLQHIRRKLPFCPAGTHLGSSPLLTLAFIWSALLPSDSSSLSSPLSSCSAALYDLRSESLARTRVLGEQASEAPSAYVPAQVDGQSSFWGSASARLLFVRSSDLNPATAFFPRANNYVNTCSWDCTAYLFPRRAWIDYFEQAIMTESNDGNIVSPSSCSVPLKGTV